MKFLLAVAFLVLASAIQTLAIQASGSPVGYAKAAGVTGGGSLTALVPTTNAELTSMLLGTTPRVILLTKLFVFTGTEGTATETGCAPWSCTPYPQQALNRVNYCSGQPAVSVTYDKAGLNPLKVGSNISILGQGSGSGIQGKGLYISGSSNVIVQNIMIYNINPRFVWGGDAITIVGSNGVWIDHNYIQKIGRQQLVMGYTASSGVTISNNQFNGQGDYSTSCNGDAYWIWLFVGINDKITVVNNYIHNTIGRGPHIGGTSGYVSMLHLVNNYYASVPGHAIDPEVGGYVLAEGNYFESVTTPITTSTAGPVYAPISSSQVSACSSYIGRNCVINSLTGSGSLVRTDTAALSKFQGVSALNNFSIMAASSVKQYVLNNAGVGRVSY